MRKAITRTALIIGSIVFGIVLLVKIFQEIPLLEVFDSFRQATPFAVIGFILISVIIMALHTLRWSVIVKSSFKHISFWQLFQYKIVGYGISFITPAAKIGGEPLRAALLQRHGIKFNKAFSTIVLDKIVDMSTNVGLFILAIFIALTSFALPKDMLFVLILICVFLVGLVGYFYFQTVRNKRFFTGIFRGLQFHRIKALKNFSVKLVEFEDVIFSFYKERTRDFYKSLAISTLTWALMFVEYKLALGLFGLSAVSFEGLFLIISMMGAAYLIPIPLALGVLEAGQVSIFTAIKLPAAAGIALSMVIRARDLIWTILGIIILLFYGFDLFKAYKQSIIKGGLKMPKED